MDFSRALQIIRSKPAQHQQWASYYSFGHGIFPKHGKVLSLVNSRRYAYFHPLTGPLTTRSEDFSRPNMNFLYQRLNWATSEIRLIEFLPQKDHEDSAEDAPLACSIHHFSLDDCPKYLALSYAWGDVNRTEPLMLNGKMLKITESLDTALRQLRRMMKKGDISRKSRIWIDAVSINQDDDVEKS
jgi:hypothetical protein